MGDFNSRPEGFHYFDRQNNTKLNLIQSSLLALGRNNYEKLFQYDQLVGDLLSNGTPFRGMPNPFHEGHPDVFAPTYRQKTGN